MQSKKRKRKKQQKKRTVLRLTGILIVLLVVLVYLLIGNSNQVKSGLANLKDKKYDQAIEDFNRALAKEKDMDEAYLGLGLSYYEKEDYKKAQNNLQLALDHKVKETPVIYNLLGLSSQKIEELDQAISYYEKGLKISENNLEVQNEMLLNITKIYEEKHDYENARNYLARYVELNPTDKDARKELDFLQTR